MKDLIDVFALLFVLKLLSYLKKNEQYLMSEDKELFLLQQCAKIVGFFSFFFFENLLAAV